MGKIKRMRRDEDRSSGTQFGPAVQAARKLVIEARKTLNIGPAYEGFKLLEVQTETKIPVDLVTTVLSVFVDTPQLPLDLQVGREQVNEIYASTIKAHTENGEPSKQLTEAFYTNALRVLLRFEDFDCALRVATEMQAAGHTMRHRTYSPLLTKACSLGKLEKAKSLYAEMKTMVNEEDATLVLEALASSPSLELSSEERKVFGIHVLTDCQKRDSSVPRLGNRLAMAANQLFHGNTQLEFAPLLESGVCKCCQQKLLSVEPSKEEVLLLIKDTEGLAPTLTPEKNVEWKKFLVWEEANLQRFDTIVDGANCSYFRSSAPGVDHDDPQYEHAELLMDLLKQMGRKPLLFFHARHFKSQGGIPKHLEAKWKPNLCIVPHGHNDDVFWLHFSLHASLLPSEKRLWLVTNDQMRDHKYEMINTMGGPFARWRERHQVACDVIWSHKDRKLLGGFYPSLDYSVQVQGSDNKWHFPKLVVGNSESSEEEGRLRERLLQLTQPDLKRELQQGKISFELFRSVRAQLSGTEFPKTWGKSYIWACV